VKIESKKHYIKSPNGRTTQVSKYLLRKPNLKRYQSANRPTVNIWIYIHMFIKAQRIEQVNQHRIIGFIFVARMTWNEHGRGASDERFRQDMASILENKYKHHIKVYTDGSKKEDRVGYSVFSNLESTKNHKKNTATKHDLPAPNNQPL
jgi:hypothetical protein